MIGQLKTGNSFKLLNLTKRGFRGQKRFFTMKIRFVCLNWLVLRNNNSFMMING
jgi:hypothetical protein